MTQSRYLLNAPAIADLAVELADTVLLDRSAMRLAGEHLRDSGDPFHTLWAQCMAHLVFAARARSGRAGWAACFFAVQDALQAGEGHPAAVLMRLPVRAGTAI